MTVEILDDRRCVLGEGPHYDATTGRVVWVDITGASVLWRRVDGPSHLPARPADGPGGSTTGSPDGGATDGLDGGATGGSDRGQFHTGDQVGAAVPTTGGGLVLCLPDRLVLRHPDGQLRELARLPRHSVHRLRSNDAKADPAGRLWHGTMGYGFQPGAGALYRLAPGADQPEPVLTGLGISNGLGWSPDGATMYHVDSPTGRVDAYAFDPTTGTPGHRRTLAVVGGAAMGTPAVVPDGLCVDADGGVWVAVWGGGAVHRFTPDGRLERTVRLPTPLVTSCAFAGAALDTLVITTAAEGRVDDPAAGRTYRYRPGDVTGLPADRYRTV